MKASNTFLYLIPFFVFPVSNFVEAGDWPLWQSKHGNGASTESPRSRYLNWTRQLWFDIQAGPIDAVSANQTSNAKAAPRELVPRNASWQYLAGRDPDKEWTKTDFKPGTRWKTGRAGFGYGDEDDETKLRMKGRYSRVYIRTEFDSKEATDQMVLSIAFDDGFIAYLNGVEIARKNVGSGQGPSAKNINDHEANSFERFPIDKNFILRMEKNVLAVEGHNAYRTSTDFSLHPVLWATGAAPVVSVETLTPAGKIPAHPPILAPPIVDFHLKPSDYLKPVN